VDLFWNLELEDWSFSELSVETVLLCKFEFHSPK
jgi:hypothetical protein